MTLEISDIRDKIVHVQQGTLDYPAVVLRLTGISPLLMNNPMAMGLPSTKDPTEDAVARAYRLDDGRLGFPAGAVRAAICNGGKGARVGKSALNTMLFEKTLVDEVLLPLESNGVALWATPDRIDYRVDARRVVVQRQGITRGRPAIDPPWSLTITVMWDIDSDHASEDAAFGKAILESAQRAGKSVGIGDYRPAHRGSFGRFLVEII